MSGLRWIALQTRPGKEFMAVEHSDRQSFTTYCPLIARKSRRARVEKLERKPLFPGYIFVKLSVETDQWRPLLSTRGVKSLVMIGSSPGYLPEGFIEELQGYEKSGVLDQLASPALQPGEHVLITAGPFKDLVAQVIKLSEHDRVWLLLDMMGRQVRISQKGDILERVS